VATPIERLAQAAYDAHRASLPTYLPPWEDITKQEQQAWKAAVSAVAGQAGGTIPEPPRGKSLVIQIGDQRHTFGTDFTVGRDGSLAIDDDFASGQHARFQTVRGLWYVEDLGSTNGTVVNGRRILSIALLRKRDKIKIGHTVMTVVSALPATRASRCGLSGCLTWWS
jgi:pSer/pThr/pTyr-binding forkhead associated (FHA) protein